VIPADTGRAAHTGGILPNARANYNAEPTDNLPVVRLDHEKRRSLDVLRKGLIRTGRRAPGSGRAVSTR